MFLWRTEENYPRILFFFFKFFITKVKQLKKYIQMIFFYYQIKVVEKIYIDDCGNKK